MAQAQEEGTNGMLLSPPPPFPPIRCPRWRARWPPSSSPIRSRRASTAPTRPCTPSTPSSAASAAERCENGVCKRRLLFVSLLLLLLLNVTVRLQIVTCCMYLRFCHCLLEQRTPRLACPPKTLASLEDMQRRTSHKSRIDSAHTRFEFRSHERIQLSINVALTLICYYGWNLVFCAHLPLPN